VVSDSSMISMVGVIKKFLLSSAHAVCISLTLDWFAGSLIWSGIDLLEGQKEFAWRFGL